MDAVIFAGSGNRPSPTMRSGDDDRQFRPLAPAAVNDREILKSRAGSSATPARLPHQRPRCARPRRADPVCRRRHRRALAGLVHQGKIGEIIQAKPEQRRRVLEDAAGVAGLHARRHEAELRLKAAETNLTRVEDVVGNWPARSTA